MCLQKGIREWFFKEPTMTINRQKKCKVLEFGRKRLKKTRFQIGYVQNHRIERNFSKNTWIAAMSATCHVTNDDSGLYELTEKKEKVRLGDGQVIYMTKVGEVEVAVGNRMITMENV